MATPLDWYNLNQLRLKGFVSQDMETQWGRMHWLSARGGGDRHAVVLVHGLGARGAHYRRLCMALLPHVRQLLLPDLLGHGHSGPPGPGYSTQTVQSALAAWLDDTLGEPSILYGNSLGGRAVLEYAIARPERVRGLVVTSPGGGRSPTLTARQVAESFQIKTHAQAMDFTDRVFSEPVPMKPLVAWVVQRQLREPQVQALLQTTGEQDVISPAALRSLTPPTLFLWGLADQVLPREHFDYFRANLPAHVRFEQPPNYGHSAYAEHPEDLASRLLRFADSL